MLNSNGRNRTFSLTRAPEHGRHSPSRSARQYAPRSAGCPTNSPATPMFLHCGSRPWRIAGSCRLPRICRTRFGNSCINNCSCIQAVHGKTHENLTVATQLLSAIRPKNLRRATGKYCRTVLFRAMIIIHKAFALITLERKMCPNSHSSPSGFARQIDKSTSNDCVNEIANVKYTEYVK